MFLPTKRVAHGAAIHAGHLMSANNGPGEVFVRNVNSHSLGVAGADPATKLPRTRGAHPSQHPASRQSEGII